LQNVQEKETHKTFKFTGGKLRIGYHRHHHHIRLIKVVALNSDTRTIKMK